MWDLIVSVPDHCLSFYFTHCPIIPVPGNHCLNYCEKAWLKFCFLSDCQMWIHNHSLSICCIVANNSCIKKHAIQRITEILRNNALLQVWWRCLKICDQTCFLYFYYNLGTSDKVRKKERKIIYFTGSKCFFIVKTIFQHRNHGSIGESGTSCNGGKL